MSLSATSQSQEFATWDRVQYRWGNYLIQAIYKWMLPTERNPDGTMMRFANLCGLSYTAGPSGINLAECQKYVVGQTQTILQN